MGNGRNVRACPGKFQAGLPEQAGDTHVAIQDINARVALVGEHLVPVEGVVRLRTLFQVGVLERGNGQLAGDPVQFLCADIRVPLQGKRLAAPAPLRQQFPDLHRAAAPGPEPGLPGLPVIPDFLQYHAVAEMPQRHAVGQPARLLRQCPDHAEMQLLAAIGHDDDLLRPQPADPVPDPGQVGGRIVIAGIAFLHDHRERVAVNVKEAVQVGAQGIIVFYKQVLLGQLHDDPGQVIPVETLRAIMGSVQADVELPVQAMARMQGLVRQRLPHGNGLRVAGLQVVHFFGGAARKLSTGSLQGAPPGIQFFHRLQRRGLQAPEAGTVFLLDHRNQHAEIGAPVPVMVLAQHLVTQEFQHPGNRVADDRRTHGAHVQVLGQVGTGIVHHDALRMRRPFHAAARVLQRARQL